MEVCLEIISGGLVIAKPIEFEGTFQVEVDFPTRDLDDAGDTFFESEPQQIADFPW